MKSIYKRLDNSPGLSSLIKRLSATLAAERGVPVMGAIAFTILSLIVHIIWIVTGSVWVGIIGFVLLHVAIFVGFLGVLLSEPLGRG